MKKPMAIHPLWIPCASGVHVVSAWYQAWYQAWGLEGSRLSPKPTCSGLFRRDASAVLVVPTGFHDMVEVLEL